MERLGANYKGVGPGIMRKIPEEALKEIKNIFDLTGAKERFEKIEKFSKEKASEMGFELKKGLDNKYIEEIFSKNSQGHNFKQE
jgi:heterodisulfide reductase subunit C